MYARRPSGASFGPDASEAADVTGSTELIVLAHGFVNLPSARHARRKGHQIALAEPRRLSALRRYRDLAFQQVARFLLIIVPGKLRHFLLPNGPTFHTELSQRLVSGRLLDLNCIHTGFKPLEASGT